MSTIKITAALIFSFIISSCAMSGRQIKNGSTVELAESGGRVFIEYLSPEFINKENQEKASAQMWSSEELEKENGETPAGGEVIIKLIGSTIYDASPENWLYVIKSNEGKELFRQSGDKRITPDYSASQYGTTWYGVDILDLGFPIGGPFKIYIINRLTNVRAAYIVYPNREIE